MENNINLSFLNNVNVSYLGTSRVNNNSDSYIIFNEKCKSLSHNNKDKLKLTRILQNIKGKNIVTLFGVLNKENNIVIKVQDYENAKKEYDINKLLQINKLQGFIKFKCFFSCNINEQFKNANKNNNVSTVELCKNIGNNEGIILMKYHEYKSLEDFLVNDIEKNKDQLMLLIEIIPQIIENYMNAFTLIGFRHGDFFLKNIVLTIRKKSLIIDFEKSNNDGKLMDFWLDIRNFFDSLSYKFSNKEFIDNISRSCMIHNAMNKDVLDIKNEFLDNIKTELLKYL